ncbi:Multidrug resistance-associated protein 1 [Halotydeus destructor]|nr:Multidrug resistance-associated protein 1 [Halotydeus destructor]
MIPSPEWNASCLSRLFFTWFDSLIKKGSKKPVVSDDIYDLSDEFKSRQTFERVSKYWSYPDKPNILPPLLKSFWPRLLGGATLQLFIIILTFVSPSALDHLLVWLANDQPYWHGSVYAAAMFIAPFLRSILTNQYDYMTAICGMQIKTAVISVLHRKSLKMSPKAKTEFPAGHILNLMSADSEALVAYIICANQWWIASLNVTIAMFMLWQQLGVATIAGVLILISIIPLNGYMANKIRLVLRFLMQEKDKRSKLMSEIISGIKVLKMYAWETSLSDQVKLIRSKEIDYLKQQTNLFTFLVFIVGCTPIFVALLTFLTFTLLSENNVLDPSKVFVSLALFTIIQNPLLQFPFLMNNLSRFSVAQKRLNAFFSCDEINPEDIGRKESKDTALDISGGKFSWASKGETTLHDINLNVKKGKLIAVVGTVGSGKSSLIAALLGEMEKIEGRINISGSVAYVPQQAWIQNATVKHNVIFSGTDDTERYGNVIRGCALEPDLKILGAGDSTEIGEKGINLSGGQKQRVSLARAVYANREIYLLDDPLSAVDSHVGKHIFDQVIGPNGLLRNTTRILVTHKVALLPHVDEIVVMKDGRISEHGSYLQLLERKGAFAEFLAEYFAEADGDEDGLEDIKASVLPELERRLSKLSVDSSSRRLRSRTARSHHHEITQSEHGDQHTEKSGQAKPTGKLMEVESTETGSVKWSIILEYVQTIGVVQCITILTLNLAMYGLSITSNLWLTAWSDDARYPERASDKDLRYVRLGIYTGLGITQTVLVFFVNLMTFYGTLRASRILHNMMLDHVLRAPMSFFDTTPAGRILNRFGKDVDNMDTAIRTSILKFVMTFFSTIITCIMITLQTPLFLLPFIVLGILYYILQKYYIMTSRQLLRLESNSRSPVYSQFSETVSGTSSIRAFQVEEYFNSECDRKNDVHNSAHLLRVTGSRWLSIRLEFLGSLIVLLAAFFAVYSRGTIDASTVGLSLNYAMTATATISMFITASSELENNLVSVERCFEYTRTPIEAPVEIESTKPKISWPENGHIQFREYSTRYRDGLDLVLKDLSFNVKGGEKVGIVGRTGAGKSSLTVALFRIVEPATGTIIIDGVDVSRVGIHSLRSGLTIIPQDPVLFTGSLRLNLDPFGDHDDSALWTVLKLAHLKNFVDSLASGLEHFITEGGENLSEVEDSNLDEATAAVDLETDDLIQETIREQFHDCTILTIAHRLNTILDYDRILVMDKGTLAEYDTPKALLDNENSIFYSMAKDAGLSAADLNREKNICIKL